MSQSVQNQTVHSPIWEVTKNVVVGGVAGSVGLACVVPAINVKNTFQTNEGWKGLKRFLENPRALMTGLVPIAGAGLPACSIAYVVDRSVRNLLSNGGKRELSKTEEIGAAALGGAVSSIVVNPSELVGVVMNKLAKKEAEEAKQQQRPPRKIEMGAVVKEIYQRNGIAGFYRGLLPTMKRETVFTIANLVFAANHPWLAAVGGAVISHPADTWKTRLQADFNTRIHFWQFLKSQPMQGLAPRLLAYMIFMYVAPRVREPLEKAFS